MFTTPEHSGQKMHLLPNMLHNFPIDTLAVDLYFSFFVTHSFIRGKSVHCRY